MIARLLSCVCSGLANFSFSIQPGLLCFSLTLFFSMFFVLFSYVCFCSLFGVLVVRYNV